MRRSVGERDGSPSKSMITKSRPACSTWPEVVVAVHPDAAGVDAVVAHGVEAASRSASCVEHVLGVGRARRRRAASIRRMSGSVGRTWARIDW